MLLPSALACDASQQHHHLFRRTHPVAFVSPPASPPTLSSQPTAMGSIVSTCRSLQTLVASAAPASSFSSTASAQSQGVAPSPCSLSPLHQMPTPPLTHSAPPLKLRLRPRPTDDDPLCPASPPAGRPTTRRKITKRLLPRGVNKRRRSADDDASRDDNTDAEGDAATDLDSGDGDLTAPPAAAAPSTPKRARIAPEQLPFGLERSDFHGLETRRRRPSGDLEPAGTDVEVEADGERWSVEDDRILVELLLNKLKLSKTEWQECARSLGKDRHSLDRRWKSLMLHGDVGLKTRGGRRMRLHSTWR